MWHCSQQECSTVKTYALIALDFVAPQTVPAQNCFAQGSKCGIADRNTLQDCSTIKTYALLRPRLGIFKPLISSGSTARLSCFVDSNALTKTLIDRQVLSFFQPPDFIKLKIILNL